MMGGLWAVFDGWDGMGWDGMGWDGMGWDGMMRCDAIYHMYYTGTHGWITTNNGQTTDSILFNSHQMAKHQSFGSLVKLSPISNIPNQPSSFLSPISQSTLPPLSLTSTSTSIPTNQAPSNNNRLNIRIIRNIRHNIRSPRKRLIRTLLILEV